MTGCLRRGDVLLSALLAGAVGQAVLDQGAFKPGARERFGTLALAGLVAALLTDRRRAQAAARRPLALVLWVLAGLGALSAAWTQGVPGDSLRWGLVTVGYGAVFVAAATLSARRRRVPVAVAGAIAVLATISTVVGLIAVAGRDPLFADYVLGTWRPGGTLEYSSALSLLIVSALPVLLTGMCRRSLAVAALAVAGATICTAGLALDRSRAELAFAVLVAIVAIGWPQRTVGASRARISAALGVLLVTAVAARLAAGAPVRLHAAPHPAHALGLLAAACLGPALLWVAAVQYRSRRPRPTMRRQWSIAALVGLMLTMTVAGAVAAAAGRGAGHPVGVQSRVTVRGRGGGFWHGRLGLWHVALQTAEDHPLTGGGADGFLAASLVHQPSSPIRFAHDLPLELAAELGIAGLLLALALYGTTARELWHHRLHDRFWLLAPAAIAFPVAGLIDWPWHLAGSGAVWAAALGALAVREPDGRKADGCGLRVRFLDPAADTNPSPVP